MRRLAAYGLRLALLWCAWWVMAALALHVGVPRLADGTRGAEATLVEVGGFPGQFVADLADVRLGDTATEWVLPSLRVATPAWNPVHVDLTLPAEHEIRLGAERIALRNGDARVELELSAGPSLTFQQFELSLDAARAESNRGWQGTVDAALLSVQPAGSDTRFTVTGSLEAVTLPLWLRREIDPSLSLAEVLQSAGFDATLEFDRPWNRQTFDAIPRPQPTGLELRSASVRWGDLDLAATGSLAFRDGVPEGVIRLQTTDWRKLHAFALAAGFLRPDEAEAWYAAFAVLSVGGDGMTLPVSFQNGFMAWGPIPGGPAPVVRIP